MPKPARFQSEIARQAAIALAMVLALVAAMGVAKLQVGSLAPAMLGREPITIDHELSLRIHEDFTAVAHGPSIGVIDTLAAFERQGGRDRLTLGRFDSAEVIWPRRALQVAQQAIVGPGFIEVFDEPAQRFRVGPGVGMLLVGVTADKTPEPRKTPNGAAESAPQDLHVIAIYTVTGRTFWTLHLLGQGQAQARNSAQVFAYRKMMAEICLSLEPLSVQPLSADQWRATGLDPSVRQAFTTGDWRAVTTRVDDNALCATLLPSETDPTLAQLQIMQVRGTLDTGVTDPDDPLYPLNLLRGMFIRRAGRAPLRNELWQDRPSEPHVWRMTLTMQGQALVRDQWYVRLGDQHGLIVVSISEGAAASNTRAQVQAAVGNLLDGQTKNHDTQAEQTSEGNAAAMVQTALQRGNDVAVTISDRLAETAQPGLRYYLESIGPAIRGYRIEQILRDDQAKPWPLAKIIRRRSGNVVLISKLLSTLDGSRFEMDVHEIQPPQQVRPTERITAEQGVLTYWRDKDQTWHAVQQRKIPLAMLLPSADSPWPVDRLRAHAGKPMIVHYASDALFRPEPCWLNVLSDEDKTLTLELRPLLAIVGDRLTLDDQGYVQRATVQTPAQPATSMIHMTLRQVDRQTLVAAIPQVAEILGQDEQTHDNEP